MNRTFSEERLLRLIQIIAISSILVAILTVLVSKAYLPTVFNSYEKKQQYCYTKHWNIDYHHIYLSCFSEEKDHWLFWLRVEEESPKIVAVVLGVNLIGFGIYRFLFPKHTKH